MRRFFQFPLLLIIVVLTFVSNSSEAAYDAYTINMYKHYKNIEPVLDPGIGGHRSSGMMIVARLSLSEGMVIPGIDKSEIISYQVFDVKGYCIGSFSNNEDFKSFVFSQKGTIEIRIELEDYWLCGYLNL